MMIQMVLAAAAGPEIKGSGVITEAFWGDVPSYYYYGFDATHGSATGRTLTDGKTVVAIVASAISTPTPTQAYIEINGFSSNPGATYFNTITVGTTTLNRSDAGSYSYSSSTGLARWSWFSSTFPLDGSGTSAWTIT